MLKSEGWMMRLAQTIAAMTVMAATAMPLSAQEINEAEAGKTLPRDSALSLPLWEAGLLAGGITQPAYPGADERVSLLTGLPYVIYRGEYLRADRGTVGVRAIKTPRVEVDVGFAASLGSRAADIEVRRGMDDLGLLLEFGPRLRVNLGDVSEGQSSSRIQLPVRAVFDVNDHFKFRGIAYELQWVKDMELPDDWTVTTNLGAVFGNQQLADTFYRVAPGEATALRPAYNATGGLIAMSATVWASRLFTRDMRFISYLRFDSVEGAANHGSPLIRRNGGWMLGLGLAWTLAQSERKASD